MFGMTRIQTGDLPIQIRVCYYWAKSAGFIEIQVIDRKKSFINEIFY